MPKPIAERPWMPGYGVPDDLVGILPWEWAEQRLIGCRNYWVVTVGAGGQPHSMPVWGIWHDDTFCFSCGPDSTKARNIAANAHVTVTNADTVEVVSVQGVARPLTGDEARRQVLDNYIGKYATSATNAREMVAFIGDMPFYVVIPARAFGVIEREEDFSRRATRWRWATV
jgi:Pyridoxamine 5'-phosphate oxidase